MRWREMLGLKPKAEEKKVKSIEASKPSAVSNFIDGFFSRISKVMALGTAVLGIGCVATPNLDTGTSSDRVSVSSDTGTVDMVPTTVQFSVEDDAQTDTESALWSMVDNKVSEIHHLLPEKTQELTTSVITKDLVSSLEVPHGHVKLHSEEGWKFFKGELSKWGGYDDILKVTEGATTLHQATMFLRTTDQLPGTKDDRIKMGEDLIREAALIPNSKIVTSPQKAKELKLALSTSVDTKVLLAQPVHIQAPENKATWIVSGAPQATPDQLVISVAPTEPETPKVDDLPPRPHVTGVIGFGAPTEAKIKELAKKRKLLESKSAVLAFTEGDAEVVKQVFGQEDKPVPAAELEEVEAPLPKAVIEEVEPVDPLIDFKGWDYNTVDPRNLNPKDMDLDADPPEDFGFIPLRTPSLIEVIRPIDGLSDPSDCLEPKNFSTPKVAISIYDVPEPKSLRSFEEKPEEAVSIAFEAPQECVDPTECPEPRFTQLG